MGSEGLRAECSHCDYARRFSPELGGRYFRCPKCKQGVLAVPRVSTEEQARWRSSEDRWLVLRDRQAAAGDPSETPTGVVATARAAQRAQADPPAAEGKRPVGRGSRGERPPLQATLKDDQAGSDEASAQAEADSRRVHAETQSSAGADAASEDHRGEVATVRRIMVECGLCGFLVRIPPEFFGKTVHCPECAGDTVFSESTLEPVKDELVDRMALETAERDLLFRLEQPKDGRWATVRSFLVGVALGLVAIVGLWGFLAARRSAYRDAMVQQAQRDGWRWATDEDAPHLLHEPWCRALGPRIAARVSEEERARRPALVLHDCD